MWEMDGALTVGDLLRLVEDNMRVNQRVSIASFPHQVAHVRRLIGDDRPASEIGYLALEQYKERRLAEFAAPKTVNIELSYIRRGFRLARRAKLIEEIPEFQLLPVHNVRTVCLSEDQARAIWSALPAHYGDFVELAWCTGWRRGEISRLEWRDIGTEWITLRAENAKARRMRRFPITEQIRRLLVRRATVRRADVPWVIHRRGQRILGFHCPFKRAARDAGCPEATLHDLRRSFAVHATRRNIPIPTQMALMGHSTLAMWARYQIVGEKDLLEAKATLEAGVAGYLPTHSNDSNRHDSRST